MNTNKGPINPENQLNFAERCIASCRKLLAQIEDVKEQVMHEFNDRVHGRQHLLELAVNEAEALAWQTDFPQLFFPVLATEKASAVAGWHAQQQRLLRQRPSLALSAIH